MRVAVDISKALPPRDGIGRHTAELVRALAAAGADLRLHAPDPNADPATLDAVLPGATLATGLDDVDVFHVTAWTPPAGFRGPLVLTCYDLTFLSHPECHTLDNRLRCLTGLLEARLAGAAVVAISRATAGELAAWLGLADAPVVYPAASPTFRPLDEAEARRRVAERFGVDGPYVLGVATREPRKNLRRLAEAHAALPGALRRRHPLLLAGGEGWGDEEPPAPARRLGHVEADDLVALYSGATVFAYPSLAEGFGLPVVEAMACGAPVLTSNVSSLPEVAGDAARLVDPLDVEAIRAGLEELLEDAGERERLRELGSRRAAEFSWERAAAEYLEIYERVGGPQAEIPPSPPFSKGGTGAR